MFKCNHCGQEYETEREMAECYIRCDDEILCHNREQQEQNDLSNLQSLYEEFLTKAYEFREEYEKELLFFPSNDVTTAPAYLSFYMLDNYDSIGLR